MKILGKDLESNLLVLLVLLFHMNGCEITSLDPTPLWYNVFV
jgi:hypothetical protein